MHEDGSLAGLNCSHSILSYYIAMLVYNVSGGSPVVDGRSSRVDRPWYFRIQSVLCAARTSGSVTTAAGGKKERNAERSLAVTDLSAAVDAWRRRTAHSCMSVSPLPSSLHAPPKRLCNACDSVWIDGSCFDYTLHALSNESIPYP